MKLIKKILLSVFLLSIVGVTGLVMFSNVEITQHPVVKTVPNEKILTE